MFDNISNRSTAVALALVVLLSVAAGGVAAVDPVNDTETTETTAVSELNSSTTIDLSSIDDNQTYRAEGVFENGTEAGMEIAINDSDSDDDGAVIYQNESMTNETVANDGTHWSAVVSEDDLADAPLAVNSNTTLDVTYYEQANESNSTTFQITVTNDGNERSVMYLGSGITENSDDVTVEDGENSLFDTKIGPQDYSTFETERDVTGNTSEVVVVLADSNVSDDFSGQFDSLDSESRFNLPLRGSAVTASLDDSGAWAFNDAIPTDFEGTTVTYESVGGEDALVYDVSDVAEDDSSVTLSANSHSGALDFFQTYGYLNALGVAGLGSLGLSISGISLGFLFVFGKPEQMDFTPDFGGE